jgi:hypothetical protein
VNDNLFTKPEPRDQPNDPASDALRRLIRALQPAAPADPSPTAHRRSGACLLVATVTLLGDHTSGRLADLVERANADAYERGFTERDEAT